MQKRLTHADLVNARSGAVDSSAIRDLLQQAQTPGVISLAGGLPDPDLFPTSELADIVARAIRSRGRDILQYATTRGEEQPRAVLGAMMGETNPDRVVVTTGSQQGLDLIARAVLDVGDTVITGDPDYVGMLSAVRSHGASPHPVTIDKDGLDTERLASDLDAGVRPKACYLVPHFHNPTGASISAERRQHLHQLSAHYGFIVIEDDPYRSLYYNGLCPTEAESDPELTVRLRSASKVLAPGLRVGGLSGPDWLTDTIVRHKQATDLHTSSLDQAVVAEALCSSWFPGHVARLRGEYGAKRDLMVGLLSEAFGRRIRFVVPDGGMFVWATFTDRIDTANMLIRALDRGVCFVPGEAFAVKADLSQSLRLCFATATKGQLAQGVRRLAETVLPGDE